MFSESVEHRVRRRLFEHFGQDRVGPTQVAYHEDLVLHFWNVEDVGVVINMGEHYYWTPKLSLLRSLSLSSPVLGLLLRAIPNLEA